MNQEVNQLSLKPHAKVKYYLQMMVVLLKAIGPSSIVKYYYIFQMFKIESVFKWLD